MGQCSAWATWPRGPWKVFLIHPSPGKASSFVFTLRDCDVERSVDKISWCQFLSARSFRPSAERRGGAARREPMPPAKALKKDAIDEAEPNNNMVDVMFPRNAHNHAASTAPLSSAISQSTHHPANFGMARGNAAYQPPHHAHGAHPFSHFGHHFHHHHHQGHPGLHLGGHQSQLQQYPVPPNAHVGSSQPQRAVVHHLPQQQPGGPTPPSPHLGGFGNKYKNKLYNARREDRINYHRTRHATGGGGGGEEEGRGGNEAALAAAAAATAAAAASASKSHGASATPVSVRPRHQPVACEVR